jgi:hypothetical protein
MCIFTMRAVLQSFFLILTVVGAHPIEKRQCQATLNTALVCTSKASYRLVIESIHCQAVAQTLQSHYFNTANGQYNGG